MLPAHAESLIPSGRAGLALASCTGCAVSVRHGGSAPGRADQAEAAILVAGPGCWPSASRAIAAVAGGGFKAVIAAEFDDFLRYNLIKTGIVPAHGSGSRRLAAGTGRIRPGDSAHGRYRPARGEGARRPGRTI